MISRRDLLIGGTAGVASAVLTRQIENIIALRDSANVEGPVQKPARLHNRGDWTRSGRDLREFTPDSLDPSDWGSVLQKAMNEMIGTEGTLHIGGGRDYLVTTTAEVEASAGSSIADNFSFNLVGDGARSSSLVTNLDIPILAINGSADGRHGTAKFASIRNLRFRGNGAGMGTGMLLTGLAYMHFENIFCMDLGVGLDTQDFLSSGFFQCYFRRNRIGARHRRRESFSNPNAINYYRVNFAQNTDWGLVLERPGLVSLDGGSVEKNGLGGNAGERGGIQILDAGQEGRSAFSARNLYFEGNSGHADVWIRQGPYPASYKFDTCEFRRVAEQSHVIHNVIVDQSSTQKDAFFRLVLDNCSFVHAGDYAPDETRRYIRINSDGEQDIVIRDPMYASALERPDIMSATPYAIGLVTRGTEAPRMALRKNMSAAVKKVDVGRYKVRLLADIVGEAFAASAECPDSPNITCAIAKSGKDLDIKATDPSGTPTDVETIHVEVWN